MRNPAGSRVDRGQNPLAVLVFVVAAFALLATSAAPPTLRGYAIGEVALDGTHPVERELRLHLDPRGGGPSAGWIQLKAQSANGLGDAWPIGVSLHLRDATGAPVPVDGNVIDGSDGNDTSGYVIPVDRCEAGCDLTWAVVVSPTQPLLPGAIVRYEADARLDYGTGPSLGPQDDGLLSLAVQDAASGPPAATWSVVAGVIAFVLGALLAPRIDRRLGDDRRAWPARFLLFLVVGWAALRVLRVAGYLTNPLAWSQAGSPLILLRALDPWPLALLGTLAAGLWLGIRRLPRDGGWTLGLAAVATAGLGGLWLVWDETSWAVFHPVVFGVVLSVPAGVAGAIVGQAWRADPSTNADRTWAAVAVVAHGILIAGFGFLAAQVVANPYQANGLSLALLVPAALVALAFARWLRGGRRWLILFDLVIVIVGVLGVFLAQSLTTFSGPIRRVELADAGVAIAVVAAIVALVTAFHRVERTSSGAGSPIIGRPDTGDPADGAGLVLDQPVT